MSKKYSCIDRAIVERICQESFPKYRKLDEVIKAVKKELHIIHSSFLLEDCHKKAEVLIDAYTGKDIKTDQAFALRLMALHASTRERLEQAAEIYSCLSAYINEEILRRMQEDSDFNAELLRNLAAEQKRNTALVGRVAQLTPKALYHDIVLQCPDAVQVSIIAKDYGMSAVAFNRLLHRLNVQFRIGKTWLLYKQYQGNGYTVTNTYTKNGLTTLIHTCWTQSGRYWLYGLLKSHGILPEVERNASGGQLSLDDLGA